MKEVEHLITIYDVFRELEARYDVGFTDQDGVYLIDVDDCENLEIYEVNKERFYIRYENDGWVEHHLFTPQQILDFLEFSEE